MSRILVGNVILSRPNPLPGLSEPLLVVVSGLKPIGYTPLFLSFVGELFYLIWQENECGGGRCYSVDDHPELPHDLSESRPKRHRISLAQCFDLYTNEPRGIPA